MPTYTFRNKETGETFDQFMTIASREQFLEENPNLETVISGAHMMKDQVKAGVRKVDNGFKEVLQKIHTRTPGSKLDL